MQIAGIPDANLRQQLDELLVNINLTKTSKVEELLVCLSDGCSA